MPDAGRNDHESQSKHSLLRSFGRSKPVIAMMHLLPLPGRTLYDSKGGMAAIVDALRRDLDILQDGGVDGLLSVTKVIVLTPFILIERLSQLWQQ